MSTAKAIAGGVLGGGVLLGALLGSYADPAMTPPPERRAALTARPDASSGAGHELAAPAAESLYVPLGRLPDLDDQAVVIGYDPPDDAWVGLERPTATDEGWILDRTVEETDVVGVDADAAATRAAEVARRARAMAESAEAGAPPDTTAPLPREPRLADAGLPAIW